MPPDLEQGHRPLIRLSSAELIDKAEAVSGKKSLGLAKQCAEEASHRWTRTLKKVLSTLDIENLMPPGWMAKAKQAARQVHADNPGAHNVYVILLHNPDHDPPFGLYVGATAHKPRIRFAQHRQGLKNSAASAPKNHGVCLLPTLYEHLSAQTREEAEMIEKQLAKKLKAAKFWVKGGH